MTDQNLSKQETKILVAIYEQFPNLYRINSRDYHNRVKRDKSLIEISKQFQHITGVILTICEIKKKINNIRTQYLHQLNKIKKSKTSGAGISDDYKPTWWLFEDLSFLAPYTGRRKGESSITHQPYEKNLDYKKDTENECTKGDLQYTNVHGVLKEDTSTEDDSTDLSDETTVTPSSKKQWCIRKSTIDRRRARENFWENMQVSLRNIANKEDDDPLHHWVMHLKGEMACIKDKKALRALKNKIMQLVQDCLDGEAE